MIGTGYVGLVSGTCFADMGFNVTCVDIDAEKIRKLEEENIIPIHEPGLAELVAKNVAAKRLHFTTNLATCVPNSDAVFIAVGTPQDEDGSADMQYVLAAAKQVAAHLQGYTAIVNKSTVPVGTAQEVHNVIQTANNSAKFDVISNPEFLREGNAIEDFMNPDRVVVGLKSEAAHAMMTKLYTPLTNKGFPLIITDPTSSELIKYAANAFLAMKITFVNELAALCDVVGADIQQVAGGIGSDARIGEKFLQPGPGYGGSCFPKDTNAIAKIGRDALVPLSLIENTIEANKRIKKSMVERIERAVGDDLKGKTVGVLGLAFKANTDDMRDAPALTILPDLAAAGAIIQAYDPEAMQEATRLLPQITLTTSAEEAAQSADILVILTEWPEFADLNYKELATTMRGQHILDLRNLLNPEDINAAGLTYTRLGQSHAKMAPFKKLLPKKLFGLIPAQK